MPKVSREDEAREQKRKTLHEVIELAAKFFEATLAVARGRQGARLSRRSRARSARRKLRFRMGYAPADRFALKEHLGGQGVPVEDMIEAGLTIAGDDIPVPYDRFRDRVMFPIPDWRGRLIAFGGRALDPEAPAKYLNSPETPLFHKGSILFNGAKARQAVHDGKALIVVEGYVDVIAMVTAGYRGRGGAARHRADRGAARLCSGASPTSRSCVSTATRPDDARPIARSISRCRNCSRARACRLRCCRKGRTPTISSARADARRWTRC